MIPLWERSDAFHFLHSGGIFRIEGGNAEPGAENAFSKRNVSLAVEAGVLTSNLRLMRGVWRCSNPTIGMPSVLTWP